jgi:hypothetical protein
MIGKVSGCAIHAAMSFCPAFEWTPDDGRKVDSCDKASSDWA